MRKIKTKLLCPYPINDSYKGLAKNILIVFAIIVVLNLLFNPAVKQDFNTYISILVLGLSLFLLSFLSHLFIKRFRKTRKWLVIHQFLIVFACIFGVLLINQVLNYLLGQAFNFDRSLIPAIGVSFISAIFITIIDYFDEVRNNLKISNTLNEKLTSQIKQQEGEDHFIVLKSKEINQELKLNIDEITFIKSAGNYLEIFTDSNNELFRGGLKDVAFLCQNHDFMAKTHRSYIVNLKKLKSSKGGSQGIELHLENCDQIIPVSRSNAKSIMASKYFKK